MRKTGSNNKELVSSLKVSPFNEEHGLCQSQCMAKSMHGILHIEWQSACLEVHIGLCLIPERIPIALCDKLLLFVAPILHGSVAHCKKHIAAPCLSVSETSLLSLLSFIFFSSSCSCSCTTASPPTSPQWLSGDVCLGNHQGKVRVIWQQTTWKIDVVLSVKRSPTGW